MLAAVSAIMAPKKFLRKPKPGFGPRSRKQGCVEAVIIIAPDLPVEWQMDRAPYVVDGGNFSCHGYVLE